MKKRNLYKITACMINFFSMVTCYSQNNYKYKAAVDTVVASGFYKINLPPAIVAKCKNNLQDIRILDEESKQVPYIIKNDLPVFKKENFTEFPIIKTDKEKYKLTHIFLKNTTAHAVSDILLFIKNSDAHRAFSISGSDDSSHWYIIKENMYLENAFSNTKENIIYTLSFPKSNYAFFQLTISGENVLPFNVVKAGIYNDDVVYGKYIELPQPVTQQKDSTDKLSYVHVQFNDNYRINKIIIDAAGTKYYRRKFLLSKHPGSDDFDQPSFSGNLNSDSSNSFTTDFKNKDLYVTIFNEDNAPLKIKDVHAFQLNASLLSYLQSGKKYHVAFGDSLQQAPEYDLKFFSDSAENNPAEITLKNIVLNKVDTAKPIAKPVNHTLLLWIAIIAALIILCFFTFKMLSEVNKKSSGN